VPVPFSGRRRPALGPQPLQVGDDQVEALAVDQLHGVVEVLAVLADVEDRHDVRVVHPRRCLGLALEADLCRVVARTGRGQHLESDAPAEGLLLGLVDDAHAAPADLAQDAVVAHLLQALAVDGYGVGGGTADVAGPRLEVLDHEQGFEDGADLVGQLGVAVAILLDGRLLAALAAGQELVGEQIDRTAFIAGGGHRTAP
jgi:hypothetical protein